MARNDHPSVDDDVARDVRRVARWHDWRPDVELEATDLYDGVTGRLTDREEVAEAVVTEDGLGRPDRIIACTIELEETAAYADAWAEGVLHDAHLRLLIGMNDSLEWIRGLALQKPVLDAQNDNNAFMYVGAGRLERFRAHW